MRARVCFLVMIALVGGACSAHTPKAKTTTTPTVPTSVTPSASPTKKAAPRVPVVRRALYVYNGAIWLYDVRTNKSRQLTRGGTVRLPKWMSSTKISFVEGSNDGTSSTLRTFDLRSNTATDLFDVPTGINTYGWSPDRETVAYITTDVQGYPHVRYRSISDGATQSVATLARALGRGADANDEARVEFSKDGRYVLIVYTPADGVEGQPVPNEQSQLQVRSLDGTLAFADQMTREPTMGVWSPDGKTLLFRDNGGIRTWTASTGQTRTVRRDVRWFDPWPLRDGTSVAYDTGADKASARVRIFSLRSATFDSVSKAGRAFPVYATPTTVWAQEITACRGACLAPAQPGSHVFAIDVRNGKERALPLQSLQDVDVAYG